VKAKALEALNTKVKFIVPYDEWMVKDGIEKIMLLQAVTELVTWKILHPFLITTCTSFVGV